ncbi:MAG: OmpA family protein [Paludibacteraceae bacterium]|nr:OmpA family protein [Paludibacteraceae bacterium]
MKKLALIILAVLSLTVNVSAQYSTKNKKAIELFNEAKKIAGKNPKKAIELYEEAYAKDKKFVEAAWKASELYSDLVEEDKQVDVLRPTILNKKHPKYFDCVVKLARACYETGKYEEALKYYNYFPEKLAPGIQKCNIALEIKSHPIPFDPKNMVPINGPYDDYWPNISADGLTFSHTVMVGKTQGLKARSDNQEDIYQSYRMSNGQWAKSSPIGEPVKTPKNEGAQSFSLDGKYMFVVACDRKESLGGCDIYYSTKVDNQWTEFVNPGEPLNSKAWESTPSINADGDELYFASSREGGMGGQDIWKCNVIRNSDGTLSFSEPVNLGENINTINDERSPFIHPDNQTLYYSSNGIDGMGGFDVFFSRKNEYNQWEKAKNVGYPLNTHRNEIGFVVNSKGDRCYFSSNGLDKNGQGLDIYEAYLDESLRPKKVDFFIGIVIDDKTEEPLEANVELFRKKDDKVESHTISDKKTGKCILRVPSTGDDYAYNVTAEGYMFLSEDITETNTGQENYIRMKKATAGSSLVLKGVFFATNSYELSEESHTELGQILRFLKENPTVKVRFEGHTDSRGSRELNTKLSDNRAKAVMNYMIANGIEKNRVSGKGFGPDRPVASNDTEEGRALNRRTELVIVE